MWNPALLTSVMYRGAYSPWWGVLPSKDIKEESRQMNYKGFFSKRCLTMMAAAGVIPLAPLSRAGAVGYKQTNLVSDEASLAPKTVDPNLVNPWGVAFFPDDPFWVSDNGKGVSTLYDGIGDNLSAAIHLTVTIPPLGDTNPGAPG